ncbi:MAG: GntR family transcriptional regulator [Pseudomonadota bacterium]
MASRQDVPRYQQIFLVLREKILSRQVPPGARIASEAELSRDFGVSRITAQRALNELASAGLVTRAKGRGTLVRENAIRSPAVETPIAKSAMTNRIIGQSRFIGESDVRLLGFSRQPAPAHVADKLALEPGSDVYFIERVRASEGTPFCYVLAYVPIEIGRTFSPAALETSLLIDLIQATGHQIASAEQFVTATIADAVHASHLDIRAGAPLLYVARTVYDTNGKPVEYFEGSFRPDKFSLSMSLENDVHADDSEPTPSPGNGT